MEPGEYEVTYTDKKGRTLKRSYIGLEKLCPGCQEFWPLDDEFFYRSNKGFHSRCKACKLSGDGRERH